MTIRINDDGLKERYGPRASTEGETAARKVSSSSLEQEIRLEITGENLGDTLTTSDVNSAVMIPAQSLIKTAYLVVDEAFTSGGSAVLDLGTYTAAGAAIDDDGIDAALAVAALVDNYVVDPCDGALVGTVVTADSYLGATYDTAAFTAGHATLVVTYVKNAE